MQVTHINNKPADTSQIHEDGDFAHTEGTAAQPYFPADQYQQTGPGKRNSAHSMTSAHPERKSGAFHSFT